MIDRTKAFEAMPRCGARTRSGAPCKRIGNSRNGRCKLHGGRAGAPAGQRNGNWRHGGESKEAIAIRRQLQAVLRQAANLLRGSK
jgi:glucans biosynthesis protein